MHFPSCKCDVYKLTQCHGLNLLLLLLYYYYYYTTSDGAVLVCQIVMFAWFSVDVCQHYTITNKIEFTGMKTFLLFFVFKQTH